MPFYVYILKSTLDGTYYKGFTENPVRRLTQHNNGETSSTRHLRPWTLVHVEQHNDKSTALRREKNLKKQNVAELKPLSTPQKILLQSFQLVRMPLSSPQSCGDKEP
jgi:putative endonuclease